MTGLDLSVPLDPGTIAALREVWLEHLVLLFRRQALSEQQLVRFARYFGEPTIPGSARRFENQPDHDPAVMLIGNIRENGKTSARCRMAKCISIPIRPSSTRR